MVFRWRWTRIYTCGGERKSYDCVIIQSSVKVILMCENNYEKIDFCRINPSNWHIDTTNHLSRPSSSNIYIASLMVLPVFSLTEPNYILSRTPYISMAYTVAPAAGTVVWAQVKKYPQWPAVVVKASDVRNNVGKKMLKSFPTSIDASKEVCVFWFNYRDPYDVVNLDAIKNFTKRVEYLDGPRTRSKEALGNAIQKAFFFIFERGNAEQKGAVLSPSFAKEAENVGYYLRQQRPGEFRGERKPQISELHSTSPLVTQFPHPYASPKNPVISKELSQPLNPIQPNFEAESPPPTSSKSKAGPVLTNSTLVALGILQNSSISNPITGIVQDNAPLSGRVARASPRPDKPRPAKRRSSSVAPKKFFVIPKVEECIIDSSVMKVEGCDVPKRDPLGQPVGTVQPASSCYLINAPVFLPSAFGGCPKNSDQECLPPRKRRRMNQVTSDLHKE